LWTDGKFLIYAQPRSWKVRNVRASPLVSVHLNSNDQGGRIVTFEGAGVLNGHSRHPDARPRLLTVRIASCGPGGFGTGLTD
jgi:hypothetical protein